MTEPCDSPMVQQGSNLCICGVPMSRHGRTTRCDAEGCDNAAEFLAYATYPADAVSFDRSSVHDLWSSYPMPMIRACCNDLPRLMREDMRHGGSTKAWVVKAVFP